MTTLATLIQECERVIGDTVNAYYSDAELTEFINEAILDLSKHFPRQLTYTIASTAGDHIYDLETDFIGVVSVEFPGGADAQDPPRYLKRRLYTHPKFWQEDGYYDMVVRHDADSDNPPQIYISDAGDGDELVIEYMAEHNALSGPTDELTLPDRYKHLIALFVRWKVWQNVATKEGMDPNPTKLLAATQEVNATRAERQYRTALKDILSAETESAQTHWTMDGKDRVY